MLHLRKFSPIYKMHTNKKAAASLIVRAVLLVVWAAVCFLLFQTKFKYHFLFIEQNQLFTPTPDYLAAFFNKPAWLSCMAGEFMQQFYHFVYGGPMVLAVSAVILCICIAAALRRVLPESAPSWLRIGGVFVIALLLSTIEARLYVYENARLASLYSLLGGTALWLGWNRISSLSDGRSALRIAIQIVGGLVMTVLCWWLFGYGMLAFLLFELLAALLHHRVPVAALAGVLLVVCLCGWTSKHYRLEKKAAVLYPGVGKWVDVKKEIGVEQLLAFDNEYYRGDYGKVIRMYEKANHPLTPEMSFFYSASAARLGVLPDKLLGMKNPNLGTFIHLDSKSSLFTIEMAAELYYLLGDMTYAERAAMHANNFSPNKRNARLIKRLAEANLVSGDYAAAQKYLSLLGKSFLYRRWVEDHTPGQFSAAVQAEIDSKRPFINTTNEVRVGDNCHTIITGLLESNPDNTVALDYLLCTDILAKQKELFLKDYNRFGPSEKALYQRLVN